MLRTRLLVRSLFLLTFFIASCARSESHELTIYYVATTGSDSNTCREPSQACRTVVEAVDRADADDEIIIAAGTYNEVPLPGSGTGTSANVFRLDFSVGIRGEGPGETIIDAGGESGGFLITGDAVVHLEGLTIQNAAGSAPGGCISVRGEATVTIENVEVTRCSPEGISHESEGLVTLTNVSVSQGISRLSGQGGTGILNHGRMIIEGGSSSGNGHNGVISLGTLTMTGTRIQNNNFGGLLLGARTSRGIRVGGEATLSDVTITNNGSNLDAATLVPGVTISSGATVTITDSSITDNYGFFVQDEETSLTMENTTVSNSPYTGMSVRAGTVDLANVVFNGNGAAAIINQAGIVVIRSSRVTDNLNGAIFNHRAGNITIIETTIDLNRGDKAAIFNAGTLNIESSLIANNPMGTHSGGYNYTAIENRGVMTIVNSTISGNSSTISAPLYSGLVNSGDLSMSYVTIAENGGDGIYLQTSASQFANVLVVKNGGQECFSPSFASDGSTATMSGVNIDTDGTCRFPETYSDAAILLDSLADNGGPTFTHALMASSPALDAATGACPAGDQRSAPRPEGSACDVGAYEAGSFSISSEGFELFELPTGTPLALFLSATLIQNANCRFGPGTAYESDDVLLKGQIVPIEGRNADSSWWWVLRGPNKHCWVSSITVNVSGNVSAVPLIAAPPLPAMATETPEPAEATETPEPAVPEPPEPTVCATTANNPKACD